MTQKVDWTEYPLVKVTWNDAASDQSWRDPSNYDDVQFYRVDTVGFLIRKNEKWVVLAGSRSRTNDRVSLTLEIPMGMVVKIETIRKKA